MSPLSLQNFGHYLFYKSHHYFWTGQTKILFKKMLTFVKIMVAFVKIMVTFIKEWRHAKCHHFGIRSFNVEFSHAREMKEERIHELTYRPFWKFLIFKSHA